MKGAPGRSSYFAPRRGAILAQLMMVLSLVTVAVLISAQWRLSRLRVSHSGYVEAAALALAQSGIEAAAAALGDGRLPAPRPLGRKIELSEARGELSVTADRTSGGARVSSCAEVSSSRVGVSTARRCTDVVFDTTRGVQVVSWLER